MKGGNVGPNMRTRSVF